MNFPTIIQYLETLNHVEGLFRTLGDIVPERDLYGEPVFRVGNFAAIFRVRRGSGVYALKCYIREPNMGPELAAFLTNPPSGYLVSARWIPDEIYVYDEHGDGQYYPVMWMEWAEGETLGRHVARLAGRDDRGGLAALALRFDRMAIWLLAQPFAHGDIKHDNILVAPGGGLRLIDFDGMFLPSTEGWRTPLPKHRTKPRSIGNKMETQPQTTKEQRLYSLGAILFATYLGGPLGAGILFRRNSINLGDEQQGLWALLIGIASTIALIIGLLQLPEHVIDRIPNALIPAIYTLAIYFIAQNLQEDVLKKHKEEEGSFYSYWRAAGFGLISLLFMLAVGFAYVFLMPDDEWDVEAYQTQLEKLDANEKEALKVFEMSGLPAPLVLEFIENTAIPRWKESQKILREIETIEHMPPPLAERHELMREYLQLRIEQYEFLAKAAKYDSADFYEEIYARHARILEIQKEIKSRL